MPKAMNLKVITNLFSRWLPLPILGLMVFIVFPPNSFAGSTGLAASQVNAAIQFTALVDSLQKLRTLECVPKAAKNHVTMFQQTSIESFETFNRKYSSYVSTVTKPMEGNGKCNGGFNSVASESKRREQATSEFENQVYNIQKFYVDNFHGHYVDVPIFISDESQEQDCYRAGDDAYYKGLEAGVNANDAISTIRIDTIRTEKMFRQYSSQNATLGDNCGQIPGDLTSMVMGQAGMLQPKMLGAKFDNPESGITGKIDGKDLSVTEGTKIERPDFGPSSVIGGAENSASNSPQGSGASGSAKSDGSAKQRRAMNGAIKEFGNSLITADGKQKNAYSEESEVSGLLKGSGAAGGDRNPASAGGQGSALEFALAAKNAAESTDKAAHDAAAAAEAAAAASLAEQQAKLSATLGSQETPLFDRVHTQLRHRKF